MALYLNLQIRTKNRNDCIECRLHPYGVYVQMMQSIEEQWNQLAKGSIQYLRRDLLPNQITLTFKLDSNGNISSLSRIDQEGYSLAAELAGKLCLKGSFGKWTEKMINDFGHTDQITPILDICEFLY